MIKTEKKYPDNIVRRGRVKVLSVLVPVLMLVLTLPRSVFGYTFLHEINRTFLIAKCIVRCNCAAMGKCHKWSILQNLAVVDKRNYPLRKIL